MHSPSGRQIFHSGRKGPCVGEKARAYDGIDPLTLHAMRRSEPTFASMGAEVLVRQFLLQAILTPHPAIQSRVLCNIILASTRPMFRDLV